MAGRPFFVIIAAIALVGGCVGEKPPKSQEGSADCEAVLGDTAERTNFQTEFEEGRRAPVSLGVFSLVHNCYREAGSRTANEYPMHFDERREASDGRQALLFGWHDITDVAFAVVVAEDGETVLFGCYHSEWDGQCKGAGLQSFVDEWSEGGSR